MSQPSKPRDEAERRQLDTASQFLTRAVPILLDLVLVRAGYHTDMARTRADAERLLVDLGILDPDAGLPARKVRSNG